MLHIHLSNRPEALAAALAAQMRADPLPLLARETVVVPSSAVARWLGFRLADALGIAVQTDFPFAAAYAWQLFGRVLPEVAPSSPFDRAALQWRLLRLLERSEAPQVTRFLAGDDGTRAWELAVRLAALFERYLVERPDWIDAWNAGRTLGLGPDERWQAAVWRALMRELPDIAGEHPRERFFDRLRASSAARERLPRRICLFAVEAMPALYWEVFDGLAEWLDLHVFALAPSREYWGDIERRRARLRMELESPAAAALFEGGHPLLASLGRTRRHAAARLADAAAAGAPPQEFFVAPSGGLLGALQRDLLDLTATTGLLPDDSLQVHACHGAQREAEVLHDRLLALFETLPDLQPSDILILTPDIESYAPALEAVLSHAAPGRRIPCAVADRPAGIASLWRALQRLCAVAGGDLDAESVMSLLEEPALRRAFGLEDGELSVLRDWTAAAGIRWAEDGRARARRGLPAEEAHTWRAGLRRLLLGVALPDAERLWDDALPVAGIEGGRAELLGRFLDFLEAMFDFSMKVGARRTAGEWCEILGAALARCCAPAEEEEAQMQRLRETLATLAERAQVAACATRLPLAVVLRELDTLLAERAPAHAFGGGAATIAALQPGRPLPARVLCLVGMNDGAWPRPATPPGFDLVARHPRAGDRDRRGEERHAFLEALLCARDALVVTYAGHDARSNLEMPPAAPLAELLDTLATMTGQAPLVVEHPLQPFGAAYFEGGAARLFSYDAAHCPTAPATAPPPFLAAAVAPLAETADALDLADLQRFCANPAKAFLRERLGIHLEAGEELLDTHEPFVPDGLERYRLREACFAGLQRGETAADSLRLLRARGWLPHGIPGELALSAAHDAADALWQSARPWVEAGGLPPVDFSFDDRRTALTAALGGLSPRGLWRVRHGRTRAKDRLRLWIDHLALQIAAPPGVGRHSALIAADGVIQLEPLENAAAHLADLLALWRAGMTRALPFYPETAWAWLDEQKSWQREWAGDSYRDIPGERDDAYVRLVLRDRADDPLGAEFQALAGRIFAPLRAALTQEGEDD